MDKSMVTCFLTHGVDLVTLLIDLQKLADMRVNNGLTALLRSFKIGACLFQYW